MSAPAGWYAQSDGTERFWTGSAWTDQIRRGPVNAYSGPAPQDGQAPQPYATAYSPQFAPPAGVYAVAPKNPGLSLLASFLLPGLGSMINGEVGKGVGILLLYLLAIPLCLILIGIPMMIAVWIWGMVDAYTGAQSWNRRHGIWS